MIYRAIVLTITFTAAALVVSAFTLGPLFLAVLGLYLPLLVPGHLVVALPAAGFGAILITRAESTGVYEADEDLRATSIRFIVLMTLVSLLTVGWLVPLANREIGGAFSRVTNGHAVEAPARTPGQLTLEELLGRSIGDADARPELLRRAGWCGAACALPIVALALHAIFRRWTYWNALRATVAVFAGCLMFLHGF